MGRGAARAAVLGGEGAACAWVPVPALSEVELCILLGPALCSLKTCLLGVSYVRDTFLGLLVVDVTEAYRKFASDVLQGRPQ